MNTYSYKIEITTEGELTEAQQEAFLIYFKYKLDSISVLPMEIEKRIESILETEHDLGIIIKKFRIEDEI